MRQKRKNKFKFPLIMMGVFLFIVLVLSSRFFQLGNLPFTRQYDETIYLLQAQSAFFSGTNLDNNWTPWSLKPVMPMYGELTTTLLMPWLGLSFLPLSVRSLLPFIIMSLLLPYFIAAIVKEITQEKTFFWSTLLIAFFNPFIWQSGRLGTDGVSSLFFAVLGVFLFLKLQNWGKLFSFLPFLVSFYQYQGYKVLIPVLVLVLCLYQLIKEWQTDKKRFAFNKKKVLPSLLLTIAMILISTVHLLLFLPKQTSYSRTAKMLHPSEFATQSSLLRQQTLSSNLNFLNHPFMLTLKEIVSRFLETYNLNTLFLTNGDEGKMFCLVHQHGIFYLIDFCLILIALGFLMKKKMNNTLIFVLLLLLVAPAPALIADGRWFFYRASFRLVPLLILAGIGAGVIWQNKKFYWRLALISFYLLSIIYFAWLYFFRLPFTSLADPFAADKVLTYYLQQQKPESTIEVWANDNRVTWMNYLYYADLINEKNIFQVKESWQKENFSWENITWKNNCFDLKELDNPSAIKLIAFDSRSCRPEKSVQDQLREAQIDYLSFDFGHGEKYFLLNDQLCSNLEIGAGLPTDNRAVFDLKNLKVADFCRFWVQRKK